MLCMTPSSNTLVLSHPARINAPTVKSAAKPSATGCGRSSNTSCSPGIRSLRGNAMGGRYRRPVGGATRSAKMHELVRRHGPARSVRRVPGSGLRGHRAPSRCPRCERPQRRPPPPAVPASPTVASIARSRRRRTRELPAGSRRRTPRGRRPADPSRPRRRRPRQRRRAPRAPARLIPEPITTEARRSPSTRLSARIPPTLSSPAMRSLGHLHRTVRPPTPSIASAHAAPASRDSSPASTGSSAGRSTTETMRAPPGRSVQVRSRRPRPAVW